jgi:hypothetical protein
MFQNNVGVEMISFGTTLPDTINSDIRHLSQRQSTPRYRPYLNHVRAGLKIDKQINVLSFMGRL